jgi:hypothetical protein
MGLYSKPKSAEQSEQPATEPTGPLGYVPSYSVADSVAYMRQMLASPIPEGQSEFGDAFRELSAELRVLLPQDDDETLLLEARRIALQTALAGVPELRDHILRERKEWLASMIYRLEQLATGAQVAEGDDDDDDEASAAEATDLQGLDPHCV